MTALFGALGLLPRGQNGIFHGAGAFAAAMNVFMSYNRPGLCCACTARTWWSEQDAPRLYGMVTGLRQRAGLPMPTVAIAPHDQPNAFARAEKNPV